jgi:hypothetical protein
MVILIIEGTGILSPSELFDLFEHELNLDSPQTGAEHHR